MIEFGLQKVINWSSSVAALWQHRGLKQPRGWTRGSSWCILFAPGIALSHLLYRCKLSARRRRRRICSVAPSVFSDLDLPDSCAALLHLPSQWHLPALGRPLWDSQCCSRSGGECSGRLCSGLNWISALLLLSSSSWTALPLPPSKSRACAPLTSLAPAWRSASHTCPCCPRSCGTFTSGTGTFWGPPAQMQSSFLFWSLNGASVGCPSTYRRFL